MSDDSYQRAINEVRALREHQKGDSLPDEREIISALRTAQYESRPIFEAADAFDAVKPFLVARDAEIERLRKLARDLYSSWLEAYYQLDPYWRERHGHEYALKKYGVPEYAWLTALKDTK